MEVANDIAVQETGSNNLSSQEVPQDTEQSDYDSDGEASLSSDEEVSKDPQEVLDKAGCLTQLANLKLNDDGSVPLELLQECLQCLLMKKLWPALILCKAISTLDPKDELVNQLESVIHQKLMIDSASDDDDDEAESDSETGSSEDSSEVETSSESSESESGTDEEDVATGGKDKEQVGHSCPACTN